MRPNRTDLAVALLLATGAVAAFGPAFRAGFISLDDPLYVTRNPHVRSGLTADNAAWAWTTGHASNWHPLTWMSLQLDATVWGDGPLGFHVTNLALHAANAVLLYVVLRVLTGARVRSAFVAALFAVHPLRVESVVWVTERKDVLSTFFGLLALFAYARHVAAPSAGRYLTVALCLALSLLSKPMLVTLPFLLLVLDWWPLRRAASPGVWPRLVLEKVPLLILCVASCVVTILVQKAGGAVASLELVPYDQRLNIAVVAYATYLGLAVWPFQLAALYPYPTGAWPSERVALSVVLLLGSTALAVWQRRQRPYLLAGWLWYVGTLVPVAGLVQVGGQAYADRYTYFPLIGIALAVVWWASELSSRVGTRPVVAIGCAAVIGLAAVSWRQATYWLDDRLLWSRTVEVTGPNGMAVVNLGISLEKGRRDLAGAARQYARAVEILPNYAPAHYSLGRMLVEQGRVRDAIPHFEKAVKLNPRLGQAYNDLGSALSREERFDEAEVRFREAVRAEPDLAVAHRNLGGVLERKGQLDDALREYREAVRLDPADGNAQGRLGRVLAQTGDFTAAVDHLSEAVRLNPESGANQFNLGVGLELSGNERAAAEAFSRAVRLEPRTAPYRIRLGTALTRLGLVEQAKEHYGLALQLEPRWPDERVRVAWVLATNPDSRVRNGGDAVLAGESACNAVQPTPARYLDTLAAAYAEAGRFSDATATAERAVAAAEAAKEAGIAQAISARLALYRDRRPFHQPPAAPR
jgi:tetratricopeptide (TPR) repeat protein